MLYLLHVKSSLQPHCMTHTFVFITTIFRPAAISAIFQSSSTSTPAMQFTERPATYINMTRLDPFLHIHLQHNGPLAKTFGTSPAPFPPSVEIIQNEFKLQTHTLAPRAPRFYYTRLAHNYAKVRSMILIVRKSTKLRYKPWTDGNYVKIHVYRFGLYSYSTFLYNERQRLVYNDHDLYATAHVRYTNPFIMVTLEST